MRKHQPHTIILHGIAREVPLNHLIHLVSMGEDIQVITTKTRVYQESPTGHWFVERDGETFGPFTAAQEAAKAAVKN